MEQGQKIEATVESGSRLLPIIGLLITITVGLNIETDFYSKPALLVAVAVGFILTVYYMFTIYRRGLNIAFMTIPILSLVILTGAVIKFCA